MHDKKAEADMIVDTLDELFPDGTAQNQLVSAQNTHKSQGGAVGVKVTDSNDNKKHDVEYLRVPDMGSIEAYQLDDGRWAITRRDKLPHNKDN